ncbi:FAD/NAD(P)-binding domain-containing protein [Favolaschia claudopus]|uniref:FAD/NAD(P)-binding domain-containing protein n=1 Tax=Favolaschia claudopus TaxID=2862362 RepID=A0AAW0DMW4_9AGAR
MDKSSSSLSVAIVGAGISGLTAAIALRRQGHRVQVFEQFHRPLEIGSISIQRNAYFVIKHLGVSIENLKGVDFTGLIGFGSDNLEGNPQTWKLPEAQKDPGIFCNRKDLADELKRLALEPSYPGEPVNLKIAKVVACDPDQGTLTLFDGEVISADLILGCDGIGSIVRTSILGYNQKALSSGHSCFRAWFEQKQVESRSEFSWITEGISGGRFIFAANEPFRAIFINACDDGKLWNLVAIYTDDNQDNPEWSQSATKEEIVDIYKDFHPNFRKVLELPPGDSYLRWKLLSLPPLPTWTRGRAVILGDSGGATTPYLGQGAAMAMEEGGTLGELFPPGTTVKDIPARLNAFVSLCKPRAEFVSNESVEQGIDPSKRGRYFRSEELQAYILLYDPISAAQKVLSELTGEPTA